MKTKKYHILSFSKEKTCYYTYTLAPIHPALGAIAYYNTTSEDCKPCCAIMQQCLDASSPYDDWAPGRRLPLLPQGGCGRTVHASAPERQVSNELCERIDRERNNRVGPVQHCGNICKTSVSITYYTYNAGTRVYTLYYYNYIGRRFPFSTVKTLPRNDTTRAIIMLHCYYFTTAVVVVVVARTHDNIPTTIRIYIL